MKPLTPSLGTIRKASENIYETLRKTSLVYAQTLSQTYQAEIWCKLEFQHYTGSFKVRGTFNKLLSLNTEEKAQGVCACSAGNHSQGLAWHARRMNISCTIVMPKATPMVKVVATRRLGADVIVHGETFTEASYHAQEIAHNKKKVLVSAFDDPWIISGNGTIGLELIEQLKDAPDILIASVGGGGLLSGIALALEDAWPKTALWASETEASASLTASLAAGKPQIAKNGGPTIAEGIAVKTIGDLPFRILKERLSRVIVVSENEIANAITSLAEMESWLIEGAAAATLAALHKHADEIKNKRVILILGGGNIDFSLVERLATRALHHRQRRKTLSISLKDQPGTLIQVLEIIASLGINVTDITHTGSDDIPVRQWIAKITLELRGQEQFARVHEKLRELHDLVQILESP